MRVVVTEPTARTEEPGGLLIRAEAARDAAIDRPVVGAALAREVADLAMAADNPLAEAIASSGEAWARRELYEHEDAQCAAERALRAARRAGSAGEESRALIVRAMIRLVSGSPAEARHDLECARAIAASGGGGDRDIGAAHQALDAEMTFASSVLLELAGQPGEARRVLESLVDQPGCGRDLQVKVLNNLGIMVSETDAHRAVDLLRTAVALSSDSSDYLGAMAMHNLGRALALAGNLPEAFATFAEVESRLVELAGPIAEHHLDVAELLAELRLLPEARVATRRALTELDGEGGALVRADALLVSARLARSDGDFVGSATAAAAACALFRRQSRPQALAHALVESARVAFLVDSPRAAAAFLEEALGTFERLGLTRELADARLFAGDLAKRSESLEVALRHWTDPVMTDPSVDPLTAARAAAEAALLASNPTASLVAARRGKRLVDRRASLASAPDLRERLLAPRQELEQLERLARSKSAPSRQLDAILRGRPPAPVPSTSHGDVDDDTILWRELQRRLVSPDQSTEELASTQRELQSVERHLRGGRWQRGAGGEARAPDGLAATRGWLAGRAALVVARVGEEAVAFDVTDRRVIQHLVGPWSELVGAGRRLRQAVARLAGRSGGGTTPSGAKVLDAADSLSSLMAPVVARLGDHSLVLVVDRGLEAVPWAALASLWDRSFCVVPLASPAAGVGADPSQPGAGGARVYVGAGPGLEHARAEVGRVARVWRSGGRPDAAVVQNRATVEGALAGVAGAGIAHLAAHAELRADNALMSPIHLADGPLTIGELVDRPSLPSTLYLSCCSLAGSTGDDPAALGAVAALLQGGVGTVVASTCRLPDADASAIAVTVHTALAGGATAADGLRDARAGHDRVTTPALAALAGLAAHTALP